MKLMLIREEKEEARDFNFVSVNRLIDGLGYGINRVVGLGSRGLS